MPAKTAAVPVAKPVAAKPLSVAGQAAQRAWQGAQAQFGAMPGMAGFFAQPGSAAAPLAAPRATMHSGPGTPGLRQGYLSLLSGQQSNGGMLGRAPGASLRDMRALYSAAGPSVMDSSNLRYLAPLVGLNQVYSGQGSGVW